MLRKRWSVREDVEPCKLKNVIYEALVYPPLHIKLGSLSSLLKCLTNRTSALSTFAMFFLHPLRRN